MAKQGVGVSMANLRKEARGRDCQVRIPGVCNGNPGPNPHGQIMLIPLQMLMAR